ncbi:helix-turn-helix domain-containing protein [Pedobacter sp. FW305-3-2-15-E-R2A2]|jgi:AraC-like DNA-binding protein|uniref:helix-turn-helix domain-containing protein n=1 Tax=Pedobacter sp. FW305-3-2-15-E-R2A2 TaxID=3140251 RepID=UPI003140BF2A
MGSNNQSNQIAEYLGTVILSGFPAVENLAALYHISISKLMRDFKSTFQTSPYLYFRRLQMEFAEEYIRSTGCSKKQMAFMLGFSNPANYTLCYNRYLRNKEEKNNHEKANDDLTERNHILISQFPLPVAMLDKNMNYLLVSKQLLSVCSLPDVDLIGKNFFDLFPGKGTDLDLLKRRVLKGEIDTLAGDYDFYIDGTLLKSTVNPWYDDVGEVGGMILFVTTY